MGALGWIVTSGLIMCGIAMVGSLVFFVTETTFRRLLMPVVALSAGTLIGGAFLHLVPEGLEEFKGETDIFFIWLLAGFLTFFALEQIIHWHHCRQADASCKAPLGYLILIGDTLHNFIGGLAVAGAFLIDIRLGMTTLLAAAAHEIPQELGDFAVLLHAGWSRKAALLLNMLSGLTFLVGGLIAYGASKTLDITFLLPFAAGNFIYIGASDLIPEVNKHKHLAENIKNFLAFAIGLALMLLLRAGHA
ncbi:MAG: ZIP family metal transporter [Desulfurivibrionaceae bacterium]|nr:ZIP family metal transporter [Desulfobulbales bacterium]MDT8334320.1 ZIP family metal transporter [Desulfurivibrionaceae bacterium]